jgi:RNA polymerase sigma-70 factor, ECF subfamily
MTDESIMEAVKNGDLQQATILFERYQKPIFNFLARMSMDRDTAEDLTQNVFFRMIRYRNSFKDGHKFQSWIYQVARNVFSDHYKKEKNQRRSDYSDVEKIHDKMPDGQEETEQWERERLLRLSLQRLSDEQRELLTLTRFQQMRYEEVAELMNTSVGNIKVRVHRAIQKLREHYFELEKS